MANQETGFVGTASVRSSRETTSRIGKEVYCEELGREIRLPVHFLLKPPVTATTSACIWDVQKGAEFHNGVFRD